MNSKTKTVIGALALTLFIGIAYYAYDYFKDIAGTPEILRESEAVSLEEGEAGQTGQTAIEDRTIMAVDFTVLDSEGREIKLSDFSGKPVVLNFWASWCPPCKEEMPEFNKAYEELGGDVVFMMVDLVDGRRETVESGAEYVLERGFSFPVYYDVKGEAGNSYGVSYIPTTIFIDSDGFVVAGAQGAISEETLRKGIEYIT